jgi:hypothetical protein
MSKRSAKKSVKRKGKKRPTFRFKLDGEWWTVKVQRPPDRELCEGTTNYRTRTVYFHPKAVKENLYGIVCHEIAHVNFVCADETHVRDHERICSVVGEWLSKTFCDGKISIGRHKAA